MLALPASTGCAAAWVSHGVGLQSPPLSPMARQHHAHEVRVCVCACVFVCNVVSTRESTTQPRACRHCPALSTSLSLSPLPLKLCHTAATRVYLMDSRSCTGEWAAGLRALRGGARGRRRSGGEGTNDSSSNSRRERERERVMRLATRLLMIM